MTTVESTHVHSHGTSMNVDKRALSRCQVMIYQGLKTICILQGIKRCAGPESSLQIAFAEELYLYCKSNSISFAELRESLNTKWNVEILEPRDGIGGHCLPKDTKMFINSSKTIRSKILQAAIEIDEEYREYFHNAKELIKPSEENDCEIIKALR